MESIPSSWEEQLKQKGCERVQVVEDQSVRVGGEGKGKIGVEVVPLLPLWELVHRVVHLLFSKEGKEKGREEK